GGIVRAVLPAAHSVLRYVRSHAGVGQLAVAAPTERREARLPAGQESLGGWVDCRRSYLESDQGGRIVTPVLPRRRHLDRLRSVRVLFAAHTAEEGGRERLGRGDPGPRRPRIVQEAVV